MSQTGQNAPDEMTWYQKLVHLNPARWIALVVAVVFVLGSFGLVITGDQKEGIVGLILALVPILQGLWTETKTTADSKVVVVAPDPIAQPTLVEPGKATTEAKVVDILNAAQNTPR
jgi:hypothetical protein